jgi:NitT/TauT family transport system substrate-binding protein
MREEIISKQPQAVEGLVKSWYQAVDFLRSNPDEAKPIIGHAFNFDAAKVNQLLGGIRIEGKEGNASAFGTPEKAGFLYALYDRISEAWLSQHVIPKRDKPEDGLDPQFVRRIQ